MKNLILYLFTVVTLFSCISNKATTCSTKTPSPKKSSKLALEVPIDSIDKHTIRIQYVVLDPVISTDTALVESWLMASHNNINFLYGSAFIFEAAPLVWYSEIDVNVDDAQNNSSKFNKMLDDVGREDGTLYVYVVGNTRNTLLGYTYVFPTCKDCYVTLAPKYDFIVLSRESIENVNTLAHETGHFFGLPHTFEIKEKLLPLYGLDDPRIFCVNSMGYVCCAADVTPEQIGIMWNYCGLNRHNLIRF